MTSTFGKMLETPMTKPVHAYVHIVWQRLDGSIWDEPSSAFDMLSFVDLGTINLALSEGYRIVKITTEN